ncbi:peptidyl-prolyl cis-trans isomerase CYP95-like [Prosopis cineraria]|uniref:peptidyl-prolyl cis-trans isomerase CYP95-like n=1 Tax=Prosopis cineraria TaxID=364024 RepID=UPI0024105363|nr:peptidyl-prolyl cis-trans isomerase CYP95-like [Prosopis cineraria]
MPKRKTTADSHNPRVFMDVSVGKVPAGTMIFELFKEAAPTTVENFRARLCTGEKGVGNVTDMPLHYKGSFFYQIWSGHSYVKGEIFSVNLAFVERAFMAKTFPMKEPHLNIINGDFCPWPLPIVMVLVLTF